MKEIFIGEYIKHQRKKLGLGQKQLCDGICQPITVSRLENGRQTPSRNVINALLQRLGLPADRYFALLSDHERKLETLQSEITSLSIQFQNSVEPEKEQIKQQLFEKIKELEGLADSNDNITRQFILHIKVIFGRADGSCFSMDEQLSMLLEAIHLTVPQFDLHNINASLYCLDEVKIINQIAGVYTNHGQHHEAADILGQLLSYIQTHHQSILYTQGHLPMVANNYARVLNICGQNEEALAAAELARQACIKYKNYQYLPRILHVMAVTCHDLGNHQRSKQLYHQAYHVCMAIDDCRGAVQLCEDAREQYGIEFEEGPSV